MSKDKGEARVAVAACLRQLTKLHTRIVRKGIRSTGDVDVLGLVRLQAAISALHLLLQETDIEILA